MRQLRLGIGSVWLRPSSPSATGIGFAIHTCYEDATGAGRNYSGEVRLYFQPADGSSQALMATTTTGADGMGHVTVSGYLSGGALAAGNWRWTVPAAPGFAASRTNPFSVVISVPTKITGVRFAHSGGMERLTGRLSYKTAGVSGATVLIERFRGNHWRRVATAQTNPSGEIAYRFSPRMTGRYRIAYRGHALPGAEASYGSFAPAVSRVARFR
jgi:5-hydroxyisourate hydrolase-like protein (transthyretin family)